MQGSYKNNGLPRPYYMKPHKRGTYEDMARQTNLTNSRKIMGYFLMLTLFGLCMFMIGQELKGLPNAGYEIVGKNVPKSSPLSQNTDGDVKHFVESGKNKDKLAEKDALANGNKESLDEFDNVVNEAPMGGLVNEAPIVGNDAGLVIDGKRSVKDASLDKKSGAGTKAESKNKPSFSASRDGDDDVAPPSVGEDKVASPSKPKSSNSKNNKVGDEAKAKVIKKTKALDTLREESRKKDPDSEEAQKIIDETVE